MTAFKTIIVDGGEDVEASAAIGPPSPLTSSVPRKRKSVFSFVLPFFGAILVLCFIGLVAGFVTQTIHVSDRIQQTQALAALHSSKSKRSWTSEECTDEPLESLRKLLELHNESSEKAITATLTAFFTELFDNCGSQYAVMFAEVFAKVSPTISSLLEEEDAIMDLTLSERSVQCDEGIFADLTSPDEDKVDSTSIGDILHELGTETNQTLSPSPTPPTPTENLTKSIVPNNLI